MGHPRHRRENIDRRISAFVSDRAVQHDVAVEGATNRIGDRIVVVVAIDQNGKDAGNRTRSFHPRSSALEEPRQIAEDARRIAAGDRGLSRRQRHIARGMSKTGDRIDDQQHRIALIAEVFGDRHCGFRGEAAHHGALVAGRNDRDRGRAVLAERVVKKFAHFATAFADERDDDGVDRRRPSQHRQKRRLADPGAREHPNSLPKTQGSEEIDDSDSRSEGRMDPPAAERRRGSRVKRHGLVSADELARAVDRPPERVHDPTFPGPMRRQRQIVGAIGARADRRVAARVERLEGGRGLVDPDHFADLDAIAHVDADALAKLEEAREAGDAIVRHRDLDNGAAHARRRQIPHSPCDPPLKALERRQRGVGASVDHADDARVLIASCSDVSDCEASAATPSKARVTSISLVISRTGSTLELSTAP